MVTRIPSEQPFGQTLELLRKGADFSLYRGWHTIKSLPVLVVSLDGEQSSPQAIRRQEHEYSLAAELDPSWAAKPLELICQESCTSIVLMDPGGEPLDLVLDREKGHSFDLTRFLRIAIGMARSLGKMHRQGLIHKDIKPANVLVSENGSAWFTGFGIASRLPHERQAPAPPEIIAGTLAYMAPEQTGRMNRSMDSRSDLYSLGITMYQILTGRLPFAADDALEWIHCHIARQPTPPASLVKVPAAISEIVMRLLAKTVEDRYQTAAGLEADLHRCLTEWETQGRIDPFPFGEHDISDQLLIPEKLYGREVEIDILLAAFARVVKEGTPELVLVSGYSGVGKSSVVNELHKVLVPPRGLFASGKFDQYKRDIPYTTLAQAFQTLVRQILVKSEAEVNQWRAAICEAVGPNGQLILNLIPELEFLMGAQPAVPDLPPQEAQSRFHLVFRRFLGAFARPEHPLALFLDDLQWLDAATLDLMQYLITGADLRHLMLIGAYRNNEVGSPHPLMRTLEEIRKAGARIKEIVLAPLRIEDVNRLVADALHCNPERAQPLAQLVHEKTAGNPLFTIQFLTALAEEGLLEFDPDGPAWVWNLERIRAKGYTDNVADLMIGKLKRLDEKTQEALQKLACLGNVVEFATLTLVYGESEEQIHSSLWEAVKRGLILRLERSYAFLHDRFQEAAYALIPEDERAAAHLRIGRVLASQTPSKELEEKIFEIVNQLDRGAGLIDSREERERVAELNLMAGKRAKASTAYAAALNYFAAGRVLLDEDSWERRHDLIFALELNSAECELLTANMDAAEKRLTMLASQARSIVESAAVAFLRLTLYTTLDRSDRGVEVCLEYQRCRGVHWSPHPTEEEVHQEYDLIWQQLGSRSIEDLVDLPLMNDIESHATLDVLTEAVTPALFTDKNLLSLVICRMVNLSLERGNSDGSCFAYVWLGMILGPHFDKYEAGFRFGRLGYDLVEKRGLHRYQARAYMSFGNLVMPWTRHVKTGRDLVRRAFDTAYRIGDLTFAAYSCNNLISNLLAAGDPLDETQREAESGLEFARKAHFGLVTDIITAQLGLIRTLRGQTLQFGSFNDQLFDETQFEQHLHADKRLALPECWYWIRKLQARTLANDYLSATDAASNAQRLLWTSPSFFEVAEYHFYGALARAAQCDTAPSTERAQHLQMLNSHLSQLEVWAENCPETFANRAALVAAEVARLEDRVSDAMRFYEKAIRSACENGFFHNEALAYELAAQFYAARGIHSVSQPYLRNARRCYERWGALGKVKQFDEHNPQIHDARDAAFPMTTMGAPIGRLDIGTVIKASQALSSEMVLQELIEKLMKIAVEHAGAERGLLIMLRGEVPQIEAQSSTGNGLAEVTVHQTAVTSLDLPQSALQYVVRTRESVVLDDASVSDLYAKDEYVRARHARSILCLPIVNQSNLIGVLYLENNLTPFAFTSDRVTVLELLASQAAISLENAQLYSELQRSETFLVEGQSLSQTGSFGWTLPSQEIEWSAETFKIFQYDAGVKPTLELIFQRIHPEDKHLVRQTLDLAVKDGTEFDIEHRLLMPDGTVKHIHVVARALKIASGSLEFVGAITDITASKQAAEKIQQSERELRQLLDLSPQHNSVIGPDMGLLYNNRVALDYHGFTLEQWQSADRNMFLHPEDADRMVGAMESNLQTRTSFEIEGRKRRKDGQYRWFLFRYSPILDDKGFVTRWYVSATDIDDRKQAEERILNENVALREEIDKASMFEEIVGTSRPIQRVLSLISKVAPTDSSVLITGETGTGKELVARAIHKLSSRSTNAFVSVNCAAVPRDLIASELFGHEKGAFTGATQRRLGRFELADRGTIFLDEVGELPAETQIALLRVLQEHEFERVGGSVSIKTDVRLIAATNRNLEAAIAAGTFRSDLFYRLNVFPIEIPPLRERKEDISLLVEYFLDRFARRTGKRFEAVEKKSLDLLQSYPWPGNIRELQNVIERSVIVCEAPVLSVDESWLRRPPADEPNVEIGALKMTPSQEKAIIEAALSESGGRVYGPSGAASKLRIPRSTLESKIRALKINKDLHKNSNKLSNS